jgi:hypothetical protein
MSAIDFIRRQHDDIRMYLAKLRELRGLEARRRTVGGLVRLARSHASIEEEFLYAKLDGDAELADVVDAAFRDHEHLEEALGELERCAPDDEALLGIVDELEEILDEHLAAEEQRLLERLAERWSAGELVELGRQMRARFAELTASAERPAIDPDQLPEA